jgi:hypothetical protein
MSNGKTAEENANHAVEWFNYTFVAWVVLTGGCILHQLYGSRVLAIATGILSVTAFIGMMVLVGIVVYYRTEGAE